MLFLSTALQSIQLSLWQGLKKNKLQGKSYHCNHYNFTAHDLYYRATAQ